MRRSVGKACGGDDRCAAPEEGEGVGVIEFHSWEGEEEGGGNQWRKRLVGPARPENAENVFSFVFCDIFPLFSLCPFPWFIFLWRDGGKENGKPHYDGMAP